MGMEKISFPQDFVWGAATSAYQIEGGVNEGGRGESIWDRYCAIPGNVQRNETGEVACDHFHRHKEDVAQMKRLGIRAYRFSIAWPRILPEGHGRVNEEGIAFYSSLVDELLAAGIEPYVTLYHWDLPQALQEIGGWANPVVADYFSEYSQIVFDRLGDRVKYWITLNEPYCAAFLGNYEGRMAPGLHDFSTAVRAAYHLYVAHGLAVKDFREKKRAGEIGIALNLMGRLPFSESGADLAAAKRADGYLNRWFLDPIIKGTYPEDMIALYRSKGVVLPEFKEEDLALMSQDLDFIALNYYNDFYVKEDPGQWPLGFRIENPPFAQVTDRNWPITEDGFTNMLLRMKQEYGIERILVSENGASFHDVVGADGHVHDGARCDYLKRHVAAMHRAMEAGVPVLGYFVWSFYDNFEWANGYDSRFGIVYIDFATQKRIVKDSGYWYAKLIAENGMQAE